MAGKSHLQLAPGRARGATPFGATKGCAWALAVFTTRGILFGVGAMYFTHGVGCKGENARKLHGMAQAIRGSGRQGYMICGDWSLSPQDLRAGWMSFLDVQPLLHGDPRSGAFTARTTGGPKLYDFALANPLAMGLAGIPRLSPDSPWAPHLGLVYTLQGAPSASGERRRKAVASLAIAHCQESNGEPRGRTLQNEVGPQHDEAQGKTWISLALREAPHCARLAPAGGEGPTGSSGR